MQVSDIAIGDRLAIGGYDKGGFRIQGAWIEGPVLITSKRLARWQGAGDATALGLGDAQTVFDFAEEPEICILGTGEAILPAENQIGVRDMFREHRRSLEIMATPAACRTFNLLSAEQRLVVALLYPV